MAAEPTTTTTTPAIESPAPATPAAQAAPPAPTAGDDPQALKAQLDSLLRWKAEAEADLKKGRDARKAAEEKAAADKAEAEKKIREAGDFAKLHDIEREKRAALEAQLAEIAPRADRQTAHEKRVLAKLEAAKAAGDLPAHVVKALDSILKIDVDEASDYLDAHRASVSAQAPAVKQAAPPAPGTGAAPSSPPAPMDLKHPSVADLQRLKTTDPVQWTRIINGQGHAPSQSFAARLTGAVMNAARK